MPLNGKNRKYRRSPIIAYKTFAPIQALGKEVKEIPPIMNKVVENNTRLIIPKKFIADTVNINDPYRRKNYDRGCCDLHIFLKKKVFYCIHINEYYNKITKKRYACE
jgi:hypothetical protein